MLVSSVRSQGKPYVDDRGKRRGEVEALETVELVDGKPMKTTKIGTTMIVDMKKKLVQFFKENLDIFA